MRRLPRCRASFQKPVAGVASAAVLGTIVVTLAACGSGGGDSATAQPIGEGIATPKPLKPFVPSDAEGAKPDLPHRIALAMDNNREFAQAIRSGVEAAAKDNGLDVVTANADGDSARNVQQIDQFFAQRIGGLVVFPINPAAQGPLLKRAIQQGMAAESALISPATTQMGVDFYSGGKVLGEDAARYIQTKLGGKANVVILNQDSLQLVRPRFKAIRQALATVPGAKIVADVEPQETSKDGGFKTMNTILQQHPHVDVVLGADSVVLGALAALQAAHKDTPNQYLGGVDGESEALADIKAGGPYKSSVTQAGPMVGYAFGQSVARWLDGKNVPQGIGIKARLLNSPQAVTKYESDASKPAQTYREYLDMFGNISYATRKNYLAYPWLP